MSRRGNRSKPKPRPASTRSTGEPDLPSLIELEQFSSSSLHQWSTAARRLEALHHALYFGLEPLRQRSGTFLLEAISAVSQANFEFKHWSRIVDYRYSMEPLSVVGSVKNEGGRFNIGAALAPGAFTPFPALYIAEDYSTAFLEKFGSSDAANVSGLTTQDFALRKPSSFTQVRIRGKLENFIDISDTNALEPLTKIIRDFQLPKGVPQAARQLGFNKSPWLVRSSTTLQRHLLHPNWRMVPMQFDLPANSQIFGRWVAAAGIHGILYPSVRNSKLRCLALFPQNWSKSSSYVEVFDTMPDGAQWTRLDGESNLI